MRTFTQCGTAGTGSAGASCVDGGDCRPGYFCADAGTGNECIRHCTLPGGSECSGTTCNAWDPPAFVDGVQYGYCL